MILDNFANELSGLAGPTGNTEAIGTSHWRCLQDVHGGDDDGGGGDGGDGGEEKKRHLRWM